MLAPNLRLENLSAALARSLQLPRARNPIFGLEDTVLLIKRSWTALLFCFIAVGCNQLEIDAADRDEKLASAIASFVDFEWQGEVFTTNCFRPEKAIDDQVLYTVGQLNGHDSVGRLDQLQIKNVEAVDTPGGCNITYSARMPVAWGKRTVPESYELILPQDVGYRAVEEFVSRYTADCVDWHAHDVTSGVFWYYFRPLNHACALADEDIFRVPAKVIPSAEETEGKYPEYHKVWEDNTLNVVAIFGKAKDEPTISDVGVRGYGNFVKAMRDELDGAEMAMEPTDGSENPGEEQPVTTIRATLADGKRVVVHAFLIQSVSAAPNSFWETYETLTPDADFIVYNGHSGLGQNVKKLARRGEWRAGQYSIVFMNGCDTYAYIDSALADAHAAVNPDDPEGTKYMDIVANAMPSYFRSMPEATMAIVRGLLSYDDPMTYEEILKNIDSSEVALVAGEHDNVYTPGM